MPSRYVRDTPVSDTREIDIEKARQGSRELLFSVGESSSTHLNPQCIDSSSISLQRDVSSDCGMDCSANSGSFPLRHGTLLLDPRPGQHLRCSIPQPSEKSRHRRSANRPALALAKPICRANYWVHNARMPESRHRFK